jgi:hypothetical protein
MLRDSIIFCLFTLFHFSYGSLVTDLHKDVLGETLKCAVLPKTLRYIDFKAAVNNYQSCRSTCKNFRDAVDEIKITYEEKDLKTKKKEKVTKSVGEYLQYLTALAKHKNRIRNFYGKKYQTLLRTGKYNNTNYRYELYDFAGVSPKLFCFISYYGSGMELEMVDSYFDARRGVRLPIEKNGHSSGNYIAYNLACIKKLLENLHDPNGNVSIKGFPLRAALLNIHCPVELVELLLDCGASMENLDCFGHSAFDVINTHLIGLGVFIAKMSARLFGKSLH